MFRWLCSLGVLTACLAIADNSFAIPEQTPEVGSNEEFGNAITTVWEIRETKKWGDELSARERAAVTRALETFDDWIMKNGVAYFTPQLFERLFDRTVVNATRIRVTASDQVFAGFDHDASSIEISMGLVAAYYWTQLAVEEATENPKLQPHLADYLFALSRNNFQRTPISASSVIRLTEFVTGEPWKPDYETTNTVDSRVFEAVRDGLIFTIMHEGCHVKIGHKPMAKSADAVRQEWEADDCSVLALPMGFGEQFNPYLPLAVFALAGLDDQQRPRLLTTHPNALCRMGRMIYSNGHRTKSVDISRPLFPLLVDMYRFRPLDAQEIAGLPAGYDHPNFVAANRIASYCGGWAMLNPRAFRAPTTPSQVIKTIDAGLAIGTPMPPMPPVPQGTPASSESIKITRVSCSLTTQSDGAPALLWEMQGKASSVQSAVIVGTSNPSYGIGSTNTVGGSSCSAWTATRPWILSVSYCGHSLSDPIETNWSSRGTSPLNASEVDATLYLYNAVTWPSGPFVTLARDAKTGLSCPGTYTFQDTPAP